MNETSTGERRTASAENAPGPHLYGGRLGESAATKKAGFAGDVLHIDAQFRVTLADYGIVISGPATGKVADTVNIRITAFGTTKKRCAGRGGSWRDWPGARFGAARPGA